MCVGGRGRWLHREGSTRQIGRHCHSHLAHQLADPCLLVPHLPFATGVFRVLLPAAVAELDAALAVDVLAAVYLLHPDAALRTLPVV